MKRTLKGEVADAMGTWDGFIPGYLEEVDSAWKDHVAVCGGSMATERLYQQVGQLASAVTTYRILQRVYAQMKGPENESEEGQCLTKS